MGGADAPSKDANASHSDAKKVRSPKRLGENLGNCEAEWGICHGPGRYLQIPQRYGRRQGGGSPSLLSVCLSDCRGWLSHNMALRNHTNDRALATGN